MSTNITVFDYIKQIDSKLQSIEFDSKKCSSYILALHYSHLNDLLNIINKINPHLYNIKAEYVYKYMMYKIPSGKKYIKWIKKDTQKEKDVTELMQKYDISYREAMASII